MSINTFFNTEYGQNEYNSKGKLSKGNTPLISSASSTNGVFGFFDIPPYYENVISLPRTGSIGEARVHDYPCCIESNCLVLVPKTKLTVKQLYYAASVLRNNKWRFKYGRQITPKRIEETPLPIMETIDNNWTRPTFNLKKIHLDFDELMLKIHEKSLGEDLFEIVKGEGEYLINCNPGKTPLISASGLNNGIIGFVDMEPIFKAPCITIERILGKALVQTMDFVTVPDDLFVLKPRIRFNMSELFCISAILYFNGWRFNYHLKVTEPRLRRIKFHYDSTTEKIKIVLK